MKKYLVHILMMVYLFKVYGSLLLYKFDLITALMWSNIHYIGVCVLLCSFLYLVKDKISGFIYSLCMSIFVARLITEIFCNGDEYWHEMILVILITIAFYFANKIILKRWKK